MVRTTTSTRPTATSRAESASAADRPANRRVGPDSARASRNGEIQRFGELRRMPIALPDDACARSCELLNEILADSLILYAFYKKHHWNVAGPTFYQLHLLFDKHAEEQQELIDLLAERVQTLGGIAVGDPRHAAELTTIDRAPDGREAVPDMIERTLQAHETVIRKTRAGIEATDESGDWGSNDLLMGDVLRTNELQVWFLAEHLVDMPLVED